MLRFAFLWTAGLIGIFFYVLVSLSSIFHIFSPCQPDPHELFVPSSQYYEAILLRTNWPTVLPCQVTSPEAKVTLHREYPPSEVEVNGVEISFNVKKGFTIHRPRPYHAGALYCVASLGNLRQSSTKYMLVYVNCEYCLHHVHSLMEVFSLSQHALYNEHMKITFYYRVTTCYLLILCPQIPGLLLLQWSKRHRAQWLWGRTCVSAALWWENETWPLSSPGNTQGNRSDTAGNRVVVLSHRLNVVVVFFYWCFTNE